MREKEGFTLVELLVALFIFTVGIVGVMALFTGAARTARRAQEETEAALVASSVAAELRSEVESGRKIAAVVDRQHADFADYTYSVTSVQLDDEGMEFFVEITVSWRRGGGRSEKFQTIIVRKQ